MAKGAQKNYEKQKLKMPVPQGKLLAIGGKEDKGGVKSRQQKKNLDFIDLEILGRFVKELKGHNPLILLLPTASLEPEESARDYLKVFESLHVNNLEVIDIRNRQDAKDPAYTKLMEKAAGVIFTGGDQLRLTSIFGGSHFLQLMKERYTFDQIVVAGTSAGAAAMSTPMIFEGETQGGMIKGDVRITTGLEFMKDVAIDTHFIARGRIVRMAQAIATNPGCIGIGLEEDTAVLVTEGRKLEVLGSGLVTVVDGMDISYTNIYEIGNGEPFKVHNLKVHLLAKGQCYHLPVFDQLHL